MPGAEANAEVVLNSDTVQQLLARINTLEQAAATPARSNEILYGSSSVEKFKAYSQKAQAVSLMLMGVSANHPVDSTREHDRRLVEWFERKGLGMQDARQFFEYFRSACEGTKSMTRLETAMRRTEVKTKYDAAMLTEKAAMEDLKVDDSLQERREALPWGDFTEFWAVFRAAFLGVEVHTWQVVHKSRFGHSAVKSMGDEPFTKWVSNSFLPQQKKETDDPHTPTQDKEFCAWISTLQANLMVANCCPTLSAALFSHPEYKELVRPEQQHKWQYVPIYDAMRDIESSPAYMLKRRKKTRRSRHLWLKARLLSSNRLTPCNLSMGLELVKNPTRRKRDRKAAVAGTTDRLRSISTTMRARGTSWSRITRSLLKQKSRP